MFFIPSSIHHRDLHSFPTRRSSDLLTQQLLPVRYTTPVTEHQQFPTVACVHSGMLTPAKPLCSCFRATVGNCWRSEEHTSELQSLTNLVCRLLLEKKK